MKKSLLMLVLLVAFAAMANAQPTFVFDPFEVHPDSNDVYEMIYVAVDGSDTSGVTLSLADDIVYDGDTALRFDWVAQRAQSWGGFAKTEFWVADTMGVWDFTIYENIYVHYYNEVASTQPGGVHLRIQLFDVSDVDVNTYDTNQLELWYSFEYVLDDEPGWNEIILPLEDVGPSATEGSNGFWRTGWSGVAGNDYLDLNMIKGIGFEVSIDAPQDYSVGAGTIIFDNFGFMGLRSVPLIVFNGAIVPTHLEVFTWGQSQYAIEEGAGYIPDTNAIKWTQGDEWGNGYTGFGFNITEPANMMGAFVLGDSMKFKMKAPSGTGTLRAQLESGANGKIGANFDPIDDGEWHEYAIPLADFDYVEGTTDFDTTAVTVVQMLAEGTAVAGTEIYIDEWWTGNPEIDVVAPPPPTGVFIAPETNSNLVTWLDVPEETGEVYNIYYSKWPITDITAPEVDGVVQGINIPENTSAFNHLLYSPIGDSTVTYYYAVTCSDAAGNESEPAIYASAITNTARGIGTMSLNAPAGFVADGDFGEWSGVTPMRMFPSEGAHIVTNTTIDGDDDLSVEAYLAADDEYFYFAFDVTDDVVDTSSATTYLKDSPDLFMGLYHAQGIPHNAYQRGENPDYQIRFLPSQAIMANISDTQILSINDADYHWEESFPVGYVIEGRISWVDIAAVGGDDVFEPAEGYRIPIDYSINDADGGGDREGIMTWSPYNDDTSWSSPSYWLFTWVGEHMSPLAIEDDSNETEALSFELGQNYPNPFNPFTNISYTLPARQDVSLKIYNAAGQLVRTLIDGTEEAGAHRTIWDGRNDNGSQVGSGVFFYQLKANDASQTRKMILLK